MCEVDKNSTELKSFIVRYFRREDENVFVLFWSSLMLEGSLLNIFIDE
jgi:hypothetical protein